jgi:GNAT superfamily N-acetyltransferase
MGTTLPGYRGRGVQRVLLTRRINDAADLGVKTLTIETLHAGAEEPPNTSCRNVIRAGFSLVYLRRQYAMQ